MNIIVIEKEIRLPFKAYEESVLKDEGDTLLVSRNDIMFCLEEPYDYTYQELIDLNLVDMVAYYTDEINLKEYFKKISK